MINQKVGGMTSFYLFKIYSKTIFFDPHLFPGATLGCSSGEDQRKAICDEVQSNMASLIIFPKLNLMSALTTNCYDEKFRVSLSRSGGEKS